MVYNISIKIIKQRIKKMDVSFTSYLISSTALLVVSCLGFTFRMINHSKFN